jgi:hypothetical protein
MEPVYTRKAAEDRRTWIDHFVALEPEAGATAVVRRVWASAKS